MVAVQLLPREEWVAPSSVVLLDEREAKDEDDTEEEEKEKAVRGVIMYYPVTPPYWGHGRSVLLVALFKLILPPL